MRAWGVWSSLMAKPATPWIQQCSRAPQPSAVSEGTGGAILAPGYVSMYPYGALRRQC